VALTGVLGTSRRRGGQLLEEVLVPLQRLLKPVADALA
jgi:hypothetical protein